MVAGVHDSDRRYPRGEPVTAPRTLDELGAITDPAERALAAKAYIEQRQDAVRIARDIRDEAVRTYAQTHSRSQTAAACGVSVTGVKQVKR